MQAVAGRKLQCTHEQATTYLPQAASRNGGCNQPKPRLSHGFCAKCAPKSLSLTIFLTQSMPLLYTISWGMPAAPMVPLPSTCRHIREAHVSTTPHLVTKAFKAAVDSYLAERVGLHILRSPTQALDPALQSFELHRYSCRLVALCVI